MTHTTPQEDAPAPDPDELVRPYMLSGCPGTAARPSPDRGPKPVVWLLRMYRAVRDGDRRLERRARRALGRLGIRLVFGRAWRLGRVDRR